MPTLEPIAYDIRRLGWSGAGMDSADSGLELRENPRTPSPGAEVGGEVDEDKGFALKPWEEIRLEELNIIEQDNLMVAMGTLNFKPLNLKENTLIAFTFLLIDTDDSLKIKVHHSSPI